MAISDLPLKVPLVFCIVLPLFSSGEGSDVDRTIALIEEWIEVKKDISQLRSQWKVEREHLKQESMLLDSEFRALQEKLEVLTSIHADLEAREQIAIESTKENERALEYLYAKCDEYQEALFELSRRLPPPLARQVQDELDVPSLASKNAGARMQSIITSFVLIHRFNQKPHVMKEIVETKDGSARQVDACYWGIATGYRIGPDGVIAQIGGPEKDTWTWRDASAHAPSIREVFQILSEEVAPTYVRLPLRISDE